MEHLQRLLEKKEGLHLMWLGNDGWLLWDGRRLVGTDLDLFNPERLFPPPVDLELLAGRLDYHFLSHTHEDHLNGESCRFLSERGTCLFLLPQSCAAKGEELGLPPQRCRIVRPGGQLSLEGLQAECIRAVHGHMGGAVYRDASLLDCGYRLDFGGKRIYQPGDTLLLQEHMEMGEVDLLFVSPTEHNTGVDGSRKLIDWLRPSWIFPQHYGTYGEAPDNLFWTHGFVEELYGVLNEEQKRRFIRPAPGEIFSIVK